MSDLPSEINKIRLSQLLRIASFVNEKMIRARAADAEHQNWDDDLYAECYFDFCRCVSCKSEDTRDDYQSSRIEYRKAKAKWLTLQHNYPIFLKLTLSQLLELANLYELVTGYSSWNNYKGRFNKMRLTQDNIAELQRLSNLEDSELKDSYNKSSFHNGIILIQAMRKINQFISAHEYINDVIPVQIYFAALTEKPQHVQTLAQASQKYTYYHEMYHPQLRVFFPTTNGSDDLC